MSDPLGNDADYSDHAEEKRTKCFRNGSSIFCNRTLLDWVSISTPTFDTSVLVLLLLLCNTALKGWGDWVYPCLDHLILLVTISPAWLTWPSPRLDQAWIHFDAKLHFIVSPLHLWIHGVGWICNHSPEEWPNLRRPYDSSSYLWLIYLNIIMLWQSKTALTLRITTDLEGTDKIRPWAYDTTNILIWFPPLEYTSKTESGKKPYSIRLLKSGWPSVSHGKRTFLRKLSYVGSHVWIVWNYPKASIFRLILTPFLRMYVNCREKVESSHLAMSEWNNAQDECAIHHHCHNIWYILTFRPLISI